MILKHLPRERKCLRSASVGVKLSRPIEPGADNTEKSFLGNVKTFCLNNRMVVVCFAVLDEMTQPGCLPTLTNIPGMTL